MKYYRKQNSISNDEWYSSLIVLNEKSYYELGLGDFSELYLIAKESGLSPDKYVEKLISSKNLPRFESEVEESLILSPIFPQEVWAAGVTYSDSMRERQAESDTPDVYAKVYSADRPEIFFKGTGERMQGPNEELGIREDSGWDVPESELAVVIINGEIAGYTIGNDMSSRSIEGENPLYLPQAKVYNKSFSLGPCITSKDEIEDPQNLKVELSITRKENIVFQGESSTSEMKRNVYELVEWLQKSNDLPQAAVLMTGTGIIPPQDFTLNEGDIVSISIEKIGILTNKIVLV
ncbi:MAG: fumarylacetoacetate hydrolase family protein [Dehalococcoidia bacterium]|nr:fumarylacetoacetate hydrolase [Chloroflexota bacterium]